MYRFHLEAEGEFMYKEDGKTVLEARFLRRPNRFIAHIEIDGQEAVAHMPNPGRMWELLFKGVTLYVVATPQNKTAYRVVGVEREGTPILLDTHYCNAVAERLINEKKVPGWEAYHVARREVKVGHSRFDLLLEKEDGTLFYVEVKSCTLFSKKGAMFPDAITERGRRHLEELMLMNEGKLEGFPPTKAAFLILVHWGHAQWFMPDYHTDLAFSQTFLDVANRLDWKALALQWDKEFSAPLVQGLCAYPEKVLAKEAHDKGAYCILLHLPKAKDLFIGQKSIPMHFEAGYYIYVGSAKANLTKRISRHQRKRKQLHWHLDYFRNHCEWIAGMPIRNSGDLECSVAEAMASICDGAIDGFGASDCQCQSHLFYMKENPIHNKKFMMAIETMRMNRLDEDILKKES